MRAGEKGESSNPKALFYVWESSIAALAGPPASACSTGVLKAGINSASSLAEITPLAPLSSQSYSIYTEMMRVLSRTYLQTRPLLDSPGKART